MSECTCHGGIRYTYTAGTLLGGFIELHVKTKNSSFFQNKNNNSTTATIDFLTLALGVADSAIRFHIRRNVTKLLTYSIALSWASGPNCPGPNLPKTTELVHSFVTFLRMASLLAFNWGCPRLMTKDGVLVEHCDLDQSCNLDQQIFKGIFVRNLRWRLKVQRISSTSLYISIQVSH